MTDISRTEREESRPNTAEPVHADTGTTGALAVEPAPDHAAGEGTRNAVLPEKADSAAASMSDESAGQLLSTNEGSRMRSRWEGIQAAFVDEPRKSVQMADELVAEAIKHLTQSLAAARENLERKWEQGNDASTEDLRLSLRRYRAFFERLLSI